jgi:hypothetical protein
MTGCNSVEEVTEACLIIHAKDPEVAGFMKLTPNPVSDRLTIELGQHQVNTEMTIRNVCGQIVYHQSLKNKIHTLDMNAFPAGMYLVQVTTAEGAWTARIIKR